VIGLSRNTAASAEAGGESDGSSVVRTALLTVATGGVTFLITNALNQPQFNSITLSILIGGIALLVRFLVDFEKRLAAVEKVEKDGMQELRDLVGETFSRISEATALYSQIEASALETHLVTRLVRNSTQISPASPPIVAQFVQMRMEEMAELLKQLSEGGAVTYYGEDREWLLGLTRNATVSVDAISMAAVDHSLWNSEIGQRYLDAQRRAARNGRRVRRIFVLDEPAMADDPLLHRAYQEQQQMQIDVRILDRRAVPIPLQVQVRDLILFDDILAYETTPTTNDPEQAQVAETRLVLTESRIKECALLFRELWDLAHEWGAVPDGQRNA